MSDNSLIEWCTATWNFLIGCTKKSAGCMHCYAIRQAWRLMHNPNPKIAKKFEGTVARDSKGELNWTGRVNFDDDLIHKPLSWRLPRRVFVNSLSDLFHENVKDEWIDLAFAVMAMCPQHAFQILTKEPERALRYLTEQRGVLTSLVTHGPAWGVGDHLFDEAAHRLQDGPLPNVWLGTSVEDQKTADERIPLLLQTPAAVRWISAEPLLGPIDLCHDTEIGPMTFLRRYELGSEIAEGVDWVVVGGESGPKARPCAEEWIGSIVYQCKAACVPVFVKQLGAYVVSEERTAPAEKNLMGQPERLKPEHRAPNGEVWAWRAGLKDPKGGDINEFPPHLRVREFPESKAVTATA